MECTLAGSQTQRQSSVALPLSPGGDSQKTMDPGSLAELEKIDPRAVPPWRREAFAEIEIEPDRELAIARAENIRSHTDIVVYSDAFGRQGNLGAAVVTLSDNVEVIESQQIQNNLQMDILGVTPTKDIQHGFNAISSLHKTCGS